MPHPDGSKPVVRFAPSPNGLLHLGHARSALLNHAFTLANNGTLLLRIEDIDRERSRPEFEVAIYSDLTWLGLSWPEPVRRQSDHFPAYRKALAMLQDRGLIYPAFLSRTEIQAKITDAERDMDVWPRDPDGAPIYPGDERELAESEWAARIATGKPFAWRLNMARALAAIGLNADGKSTKPLTWREAGEEAGPGQEIVADPAKWGDVILARRDTPVSYHLAVVLDDFDQGITDVIRGQDLFESTSIHRLLQTLLDLPAPTYRHHRLVTDLKGRKLAKSDRDKSLAAMRAAGFTISDIKRLSGITARLEPFLT